MFGSFLGRFKNALVVVPTHLPAPLPAPQTERPAPNIDLNGNTPVSMGVAQQVASLGPNQSFSIKRTALPAGEELSFSKSVPPPLTGPINQSSSAQDTAGLADAINALRHDLQQQRREAAGPSWEDFRDLQRQMNERQQSPVTRPHRTKYEAEQEYLGEPLGPMLIDGDPGFVFCDAAGRHQAYRITPTGLAYAREVPRNR